MRSSSGFRGQTFDLDRAARTSSAVSAPSATHRSAARPWPRTHRRLLAECALLAADAALALTAIALMQALCTRMSSVAAVRSVGALPLWPYDPLLVALIVIPLLLTPHTISRALYAPRRLVLGVALAGLVVAAGAYFLGVALPRLYVPLAALAALVALGICRALSPRMLAGMRAWPRRVLLVGDDKPTEIIGRLLFHYQQQGIVVAGRLGADAPFRQPSVDELVRNAMALDVDDVVIGREWYARECATLADALDVIQRLPARVYLAPDEAGLALAAPPRTLEGLPLVRLAPVPISAWQLVVKRGMDVLIALAALMVFSPLLLAIAVAIRLSSPGPVFYRQVRVGRYGRLFTIYKFRTMRVAHSAGSGIGDGTSGVEKALYKSSGDPRVTRVGTLLRRTSLDELPQLFNVLKGEMSLVGPRPELPAIVKLYEPWQHVRFLLPQGLTGWWQVNGRGERLMRQHTEDDLYYVRTFSLLLDVKILLMTVKAVITGRGAF